MSASFPTVLEADPGVEQLADQLFADLNCKEPLTKVFIRAMFVAVKVFDWKQGNYGPANIAEFGYLGVVVRTNDKIKRLANLLKKQEEPADETIEDTLGDIANYGIIGLMNRWGLWPGVPGSAAAREAVELSDRRAIVKKHVG